MQGYSNNFSSNMQMAGPMEKMYPKKPMFGECLEKMYPRTYHLIQPHVMRHCNMLDAQFGESYCPTEEHVQAMVDDIYRNVEGDLDAEDSMPMDYGSRQFGFGGRRLGRDLVLILLLDQLLRRRRPYGGFYGYPGFGGIY